MNQPEWYNYKKHPVLCRRQWNQTVTVHMQPYIRYSVVPLLTGAPGSSGIAWHTGSGW